ncbi:hypothetical protein Tcan_00182 [Toxocara canis]|uniref:Uncharacterized protein n=1 Tax=Toxocara canis TaxID=6265 RepID=A0A0B2UVT3_TOXCA|nr:hypothetical protein Tcan_00182 [Toxocara canis]
MLKKKNLSLFLDALYGLNVNIFYEYLSNMRPRNNIVIKHLNSLGLDQTSFHDVLHLMAANQHIAYTRERLRFLSRCKRNGVIPHFIAYATDHLWSGNQSFDLLIAKVQRRYLCLEYNNCRRLLFRYIDISNSSFTSLRRTLPPHILGKLADIFSISCTTISHHSNFQFGKKYESHTSRNDNTDKAGVILSDDHRSSDDYNVHIVSVDYQPADNDHTVRCISIGDCELDDASTSLLSLGPSFSPSIKVDKSTACCVRSNLVRSFIVLRYSETSSPTVSNALQSLSHSAPFSALNVSLPLPVNHLEPVFIACLEDVHDLLVKYGRKRLADNLSIEERSAL